MDAHTNREWTAERVIEIIRTLAAEDELPGRLHTAPISGEDTAETLGLDSIGAFSLIDRLETESGTVLPDDFLALGDSIATIAERLQGVANAGD